MYSVEARRMRLTKATRVGELEENPATENTRRGEDLPCEAKSVMRSMLVVSPRRTLKLYMHCDSSYR